MIYRISIDLPLAPGEEYAFVSYNRHVRTPGYLATGTDSRRFFGVIPVLAVAECARS